MNKNLILSSLLLSSFIFYSGCMKKESPNIYPEDSLNNNPPVETSTIESTPPPTETATSEYIPNSKYHKVKTVQGETITVGIHERGFEFPEYKGKIVLLEFFGKECHYCFEEMPIIEKVKNSYQDRVSVIAVQAMSPMLKWEAKRFIQQHNMNYPVIDRDEADKILLHISDIYQWTGFLPYVMLIKDGQIEQVFKGVNNMSFEQLSQGINDIK
ncbi:Thioredoxin [hydrothermal vent metagenome]|uniref:Thioredoxin n=1 Tax=hydrothermal vent metagenome TaxID=652676 RepID=A0A1W1CI93_9ZZZZ